MHDGLPLKFLTGFENDMNIDKVFSTLELKGHTYIKAVALLTICVFLITAPAPEANVLAQLTSNLVAGEEAHASELQYPLS